MTKTLHAVVLFCPLLLPELSQDGERMVEEEVQKALYGVEEMKEVMRSNELKHRHLMRSLRRSGEKKQVGG